MKLAFAILIALAVAPIGSAYGHNQGVCGPDGCPGDEAEDSPFTKNNEGKLEVDVDHLLEMPGAELLVLQAALKGEDADEVFDLAEEERKELLTKVEELLQNGSKTAKADCKTCRGKASSDTGGCSSCKGGGDSGGGGGGGGGAGGQQQQQQPTPMMSAAGGGMQSGGGGGSSGGGGSGSGGGGGGGGGSASGGRPAYAPPPTAFHLAKPIPDVAPVTVPVRTTAAPKKAPSTTPEVAGPSTFTPSIRLLQNVSPPTTTLNVQRAPASVSSKARSGSLRGTTQARRGFVR